MGGGQSKTIKIGSLKCKVVSEVHKNDNQSVYKVIDTKFSCVLIMIATNMRELVFVYP